MSAPFQSSPIYRFGIFELDSRRRELRRNGVKLKVQEQPYNVLLKLVEHGGEIVTREELRSTLWHSDTFVDFENGLNTAIRRLRDTLGDSADNPVFIETVPRHGYRFLASLECANSPFPSAPPRVMPHVAQSRSKWKILSLIGLALLAVGSLILAVRHTTRRPVEAPELNQRQLTSSFIDSPVVSSAISPDGKYLAYTDGKGIHVQIIELGETLDIKSPNADASVTWWIGAWYQDSTKFLANATTTAGGASIWSVPLVGSGATKLRDGAIASSTSPDGSQIVFTTARTQNPFALTGRGYAFMGEREVWVMSVDGTGAHRLFSVSGNESVARVRWSPDGQQLAYMHTSASATWPVIALELRNVTGEEPIVIARDPGLRDFYWISPGHIIYALCSGGLIPSSCDLFELRLSAGLRERSEPRRLTNWAGFNVDSLSATRDSGKIIFTKQSVRSLIQVGELSAQRKLTGLKYVTDRQGWDSPTSWTTDSSEIVFNSARNGHLGIYKHPVNSETPVKLADSGILPRVAPDGHWIIYHRMLQQTSVEAAVMRVPVDGGPPEQILVARLYQVLSCALEPGTFCAYGQLNDDGNTVVISKLDPGKGRVGELARFPIDPKFQYGWSLSPDGKKIAVEKGGTNELRFLSLENGNTSELKVANYSGFNTLDWSADNKGVFVGSADNSGVTLLFIDLNGVAHPLLRELGAAEIWAIAAADRRHVAVPRLEITSNVWMIDNLERVVN